MKWIVPFLLVLSCIPCRAVVPSADSTKTCFQLRQLASPLVFAAGGTLGFTSCWKEQVNEPVRSYMSGLRNGNYYHFDNYIQYVPVAMSLALCLDNRYKEGWQDRMLLAFTGAVTEAALVNGIKYTVCEMRPNGSRRNSFPSGHTATAFMGAELVRMEYGPWWGLAAYSVAALTGFMRVYNNYHWCNDVLAGAAVGILSAKIAYWLLPYERRVLEKMDILPSLAYDPDSGALPVLALSYSF